MAQFGLTQSGGFKPAPEGKQPAVLAEIAWALVEDRFEGKGEQLKMFWCFQLQAEDTEGERYVVDLELFPQLSPKNKVGKLCKSRSASREPLTQEQLNQWRAYVMGDLILKDEEGNMILDDKGIAQTKDFLTVEDFLAFVNSDEYPAPPLVGVTAILEIEHKESANGRTYANIVDIHINGKVDSLGNVIKGKDGRPEPAFEMELDDSYVNRANRQAEIQRRIVEKENKKSAKPATQQSNSGSKAKVPF